jgi:hypothetical protein
MTALVVSGAVAAGLGAVATVGALLLGQTSTSSFGVGLGGAGLGLSGAGAGLLTGGFRL